MKQKIVLVLAAVTSLSMGLQAAPLVTGKNMVWKWGSKTVVKTVDGVKNVSTAVNNETAGISNPPVAVTPGTVFKISFEARGDIKLESMVTWSVKGEEPKNKSIIKPSYLGEEWKKFTSEVTVPEGKNTAAFALYYYKQAGWFEVRNFTVEAPAPAAK